MRTSIGVLAVFLVLQTAPSSAAQSGVPTEQLRGSVDRVLKMLSDPASRRESPRERRAALRKIADDIFDWEETAKRSLGTHWQQRTPAEREEFVGLFAELLERSYMSKVELYDGERIGFAGETIDGDLATVRTRLVNRQGSEMGINYKMLRRDGGRWRVYDVEIEGVSLVANYRSQLNTLLRRSTYPELVRSLKARSAGADTEAAMASPRTK